MATKQLSILVPLDGSHLAEAVLPATVALASRSRARIIVLHVLEQNAPTTIHGDRHLTTSAEAQRYLEEVVARLQTAGVLAESHVHENKEHNIALSIFEHAQELNIDIVAMCTHGHSGLREMLFGSIALKALQRGTQSILLVSPREDGSAPHFSLQHILVPLDGTVAHEPALSPAISLACLFGASVHLVLVIPTLATLSGGQAVTGMLLPTTMRAVLELAQQGAASYLEEAVGQCQAEGVKVTAEVLRGDAVPVVLSRAERLDADLIVMASHGRAGLDALLAGSVAPRIAGRVGRPLLLVRANAGELKIPVEVIKESQ